MGQDSSRQRGDQPLEQHDRQLAIEHSLDRLTPARRARWPKEDQRSSSRLSERDARGGDDAGARRGGPGYLS